MFWKKDNTEKKLQLLNVILKKSFGNVKKDTANIFQWLQYLYSRNIEQERQIRQFQIELSYMPKTREDIRLIIDDYYSFDGIMAKIRELNSKIDELARIRQAEIQERQLPVEINSNLSNIHSRLDRLEQKKLGMKERIVKRITRNSKDYIKGLILFYIKKYEKISAFQLKEIVVDEQNCCSKTSFYRLLEELEEVEEIGVIRQGKEKHYMSKVMKHI